MQSTIPTVSYGNRLVNKALWHVNVGEIREEKEEQRIRNAYKK